MGRGPEGVGDCLCQRREIDEGSLENDREMHVSLITRIGCLLGLKVRT